MTGNKQLDDLIQFILNTWGIEIDEARAQGWADELDGGGGRTYEELRGDIFTHVVTDEKVDAYVLEQFGERGLGVATEDETEDERVQRISDELQSGERTFKDFGETLEGFQFPDGRGVERFGDQTLPEGMRLVKVTNPAGSDQPAIYFAVGTVFGIEVAYEIGDIARLEEMFGGLDAFDDVSTMTQLQFDNAGILSVGDVDEIAGATGSLQAQYERDMRELGLESPPQWMVDDPEAMARFITGTNEGWSAERIWGTLKDLDSFKARFPGISTLQNQLALSDIGSAVQEHLRREAAIRQTLLQFRGPDTDVSIDYVGSLISSGWQSGEIAEWIELEAEVKGNLEALENINAILVYNGGQALSPDDFVDYLRDSKNVGEDGFTPSELFESINDALRQTALQAAGLDISTELAESLGTGTSFSIASPTAFNDEAQQVAAIVVANRHALDLGAYGLDQDQVIQFFLGETDDPEIGRKLERLGRERGIAAEGFASTAAFTDASGRLRTQGFSGV